jgi:hypothetical protein
MPWSLRRLIGLLIPPLVVLLACLVWLPRAERVASAPSAVWTRQVDAAGHTAGTSVAVDAAGNAYLAGWTTTGLPGSMYAGGQRDAFLRKYAPDGTERWTREFGTPTADAVMDVAVDATGNVYVSGQTSGALPGQVLLGESDAFLRKYDTTGVELWTRQFGSRGATAAARVVVDSASNIYVGGWTGGALPGQTALGGSDAYVRKYSPTGSEIWTQQFGTPGHDQVTSLALDHEGALYVLGQSGQPGGSFMRKYLPSGTLAWIRNLPTADGEFTSSMGIDSAAAVFVGGRRGGDEGVGFVRKYAPDGAVLWDRELGRPISSSPVSIVTDIVVDSTGVYALGHAGGLLPGESGSAGGGFDIFVIKLDPDRLRVRLMSWHLGSPGNDISSRLVEDSTGGLYLAGWSTGGLAGNRGSGLSAAFIARLQ